MHLNEGGLILFMESIEGHDEMVTWHFMDSWKNRWVNIYEVSFEVTEEIFANVIGLALEGKNSRMQPRVEDVTIMGKFFHSDEALVHLRGGVSHEKLPKP